MENSAELQAIFTPWAQTKCGPGDWVWGSGSGGGSKLWLPSAMGRADLSDIGPTRDRVETLITCGKESGLVNG